MIQSFLDAMQTSPLMWGGFIEIALLVLLTGYYLFKEGASLRLMLFVMVVGTVVIGLSMALAMAIINFEETWRIWVIAGIIIFATMVLAEKHLSRKNKRKNTDDTP